MKHTVDRAGIVSSVIPKLRLRLILNSFLIRSVFFFSSRRRHTRFDCDWSSDVCSSDLSWRRSESVRLCFDWRWTATWCWAPWPRRTTGQPSRPGRVPAWPRRQARSRWAPIGRGAGRGRGEISGGAGSFKKKKKKKYERDFREDNINMELVNKIYFECYAIDRCS